MIFYRAVNEGFWDFIYIYPHYHNFIILVFRETLFICPGKPGMNLFGSHTNHENCLPMMDTGSGPLVRHGGKRVFKF